MSDLNFIAITGTAWRDASVKTTATGLHVAYFTVAVHRPSPSNALDFLHVQAWQELADKSAGIHDQDRISVKGTLQFQKYTGNDGVERQYYRIVAREIEIAPEENEKDIELFYQALKPQGSVELQA